MKTPSDEPPPPLPTQALPPTQAPHPSVLGRKLNASFTKKRGEKKAAGSSEPTKETRFIHKVTHIHKNELRRRELPTASNPSPTPKPFQTSLLGTPPQSGVRLPPRGPLPSENSVRSPIQLEAPNLSIPLRTHLFLFHHPQAAVLMFPDFSRISGNLTPSICWGWDKGDWVYAFHNLKLARPA